MVNVPLQGAAAVGGSVSLAMPGSSKLEEFFMRFGAVAYQHGLQRAERITPPDFPLGSEQVVYRYRHPDDHADHFSKSTMWQIGPAIFAANGLPPYKSWKEFRPIVERGVKTLLETRDPAEKDAPFTSLTLRYIDAFRGEFLNGRTKQELIESLGFRLQNPNAVTANLRDAAEINSVIRVQLPIYGARTFTVSVAPGQLAGEEAVILDMAISMDDPVAAEADVVLGAFDEARDVLHAAFEGMAKPFWDILKPVKEA